MKDKSFQEGIELVSKGLWNIAFRGGPIEKFHSEGTPIGDREMEIINRYGFNRLCFMMELFLSGKGDDFINLCGANAQILSYFDKMNPDSPEVKDLKQELAIIRNKNVNQTNTPREK